MKNRSDRSPSFARKIIRLGIIIFIVVLLVYVLSGTIMTAVGEFLVLTEEPVRSDAAVVLSTGVEYYPRLMEAAKLFRDGLAARVAINGNRKSETLRWLERQGFQACCPWYENAVRILEVLGVPRKDVIAINAEDAYDTVSEAKIVGKALADEGVTSVIVTTSKYHTRRAGYIWRHLYAGQFTIRVAAASKDPFSPRAWWKEGRQIRWLLAEYGAWIYFFWKTGWDTDRGLTRFFWG
jgi:uncharacterized SAM-binding protein YcdF (DUF218 family)